MFSFTEYISAWLVYIVCTIALLTVFWRITRTLPGYHLKQCLRLLAACFLLVPARVEDTVLYWSPAWIKALLQLIFSSGEGVWPFVKLLLVFSLLTLAIYGLLTLIIRLAYPTSRQYS